jgi:hypothetical protein
MSLDFKQFLIAQWIYGYVAYKENQQNFHF